MKKKIVWVVEIWDGLDISERVFESKEVAFAFGRKAMSVGWDGWEGRKLPPSEVGVVKCDRKYLQEQIEREKPDLFLEATGECYVLYAFLDQGTGNGLIYSIQKDKVDGRFCNCDNLDCTLKKTFKECALNLEQKTSDTLSD
jgi:hypothetical protein